MSTSTCIALFAAFMSAMSIFFIKPKEDNKVEEDTKKKELK